VITLAQADKAIGQKVVYHAPHVPQTSPGEEGVITSVGARGVFVRYGSDSGSKMTLPEQLTFVYREPATSAVQLLCEESPDGAMTHHMVPSSFPRSSTVATSMECRYCHKTEAIILKEGGTRA
jgi:hypothetical protein